MQHCRVIVKSLSHSYGNPLPAVCEDVCVCVCVSVLFRMSKGLLACVCVFSGDGIVVWRGRIKLT